RWSSTTPVEYVAADQQVRDARNILHEVNAIPDIQRCIYALKIRFARSRGFCKDRRDGRGSENIYVRRAVPDNQDGPRGFVEAVERIECAGSCCRAPFRIARAPGHGEAGGKLGIQTVA